MPDESRGHRVRELRNALDISQRSLSEILDVRQATVSAWETGKAEPNRGTLRLLSDLTKFDKATYKWLIGERARPRIIPASDDEGASAAETYGFADEESRERASSALEELEFIMGRIETELRLLREFQESVTGLGDGSLESLTDHLNREAETFSHTLKLVKRMLEEIAESGTAVVESPHETPETE